MPLKKNDKKIVALAKKVKDELQKLGLGRILFENSGNIGKNYRRHDEVGTPVCITVDFESLDNQTVTVRDRDSMKQERISLDKVSEHLKKII